MRPLRVLIYACGTPAEIREQHEQCLQMAASYGPHEVVSLAAEQPGQTDAWTSACAMYCNGEVDMILVASRELVPGLDPIESVTREIRRLAPVSESPRHRRSRPLRRRRAGGA